MLVRRCGSCCSRAKAEIAIMILHNRAMHQGSQAHRRVEILGPKARNFGNFGRVFDELIEILGPKQGVFRRHLPPKGTCPATEGPWWAAGRNWSRPFHQLVEICRGSLRALQCIRKQLHQCCVLYSNPAPSTTRPTRDSPCCNTPNVTV
jgi:hypothetical protein